MCIVTVAAGGRKSEHLQSHSLDMMELILSTTSHLKHLEEKLQEASRTMDSLCQNLEEK